MSDNWDSYFCTVDGKAASILLDLTYGDQAPLRSAPVVGYLRLSVRSPDDDGFPQEDEFNDLHAVEDALDQAVAVSGTGLFVGRCVTGGHVDFFVYLHRAGAWNDFASALMSRFPLYAWESGAAADPEWNTYRDFLFPDDHTMLLMQNRRALDNLRESGDRLSLARFIDHMVDVPVDGKDAFAGEAENRGFFLHEDEAVDAPAPVPAPRRLRLSRSDAPEEINAVTSDLAALALKHGGVYIGWSCPIVQQEP
jgi:GNAT superfamily N-acetyltransferase